MLKRFTLSLSLLVTFGSMHAMTILHDIDTSLLGQPQHQVVTFDGRHRTTYAAYPKEALATIDNHKLILHGATALSTASFFYMGAKAISNAIANIWPSKLPNTLDQRHVLAYIALSGISYGLAQSSWKLYDNVIKLYQRIISHNTQDSFFASDIPATPLPENTEIAAINAANPNLIWVRTCHEMLAPPAYPLVASAPPFENEEQYQQMYPQIDAPHRNIQASAPSAPIAATRPATQPAQTQLACSICLSAINKRNAAENMALRCGHVFHANCIRSTASNPRGICPECRTPVHQ
jgi:hypothetical protein